MSKPTDSIKTAASDIHDRFIHTAEWESYPDEQEIEGMIRAAYAEREALMAEREKVLKEALVHCFREEGVLEVTLGDTEVYMVTPDETFYNVWCADGIPYRTPEEAIDAALALLGGKEEGNE